MNLTRAISIALSSVAFAFAGCALPTTSSIDESVDDEAVGAEQDELTASIVVPVTKLTMNLPDRTGLHLIKTKADFLRVFGINASGVDFSREWVVFYGAGATYSTSTPVVTLTRSGNGRSLSMLGQVRSPGHGCFTLLSSKVPYFIGKFSRTGISSSTAVTQRYDRTITPCTGSVSLNHCTVTGCPAGQICRIVDGVDGCMANPNSCDFVACPVGTVCGFDSASRAFCGRAPAPVGQDEGLVVSFPDGLTVTFPTGGIPSVCKTVRCGAGRVCAVTFNGTATCVSTGVKTPN